MNSDELNKILENNKLWVENVKKGKYADLTDANLTDANLERILNKCGLRRYNNIQQLQISKSKIMPINYKKEFLKLS